MFVLGLPIAETLISMARRFLKRFEQKNAGGLFEADKNHLHHRLLALGIDHARAVFILYGVGLLLACGALVSMFMTAREAALLALMLLLAGFIGVKGLGYDEFAVIRNGVVLRLYDTPVLKKSMFAVFVDVLIVAVGVYGAVALKTDDWNLATFRTTALLDDRRSRARHRWGVLARWTSIEEAGASRAPKISFAPPAQCSSRH